MPRGRPRGQRTFAEAISIVRPLDLRTKRDWSSWARTNARAHGLPVRPDVAYVHEGWIGWPDFLHGVADTPARFRPFADARTYAHRLNLQSKAAWIAWAATDTRPPDIPVRPDSVYSGQGWTTWGAFLGFDPRAKTNKVSPLSLPTTPNSILRVVRARKRMTLRDVTQGVGLSLSYLSELERGVKKPSSAMLNKLAAYYGVTPISLIDSVGTRDTRHDMVARAQDRNPTYDSACRASSDVLVTQNREHG